MPAISRDEAEAILADIESRFALDFALNPGGPTLRGPDHEGLPAGSWSIDWEEGPEGWAVLYSDESRRPGVLVEPIMSVVLGLYPA